MAMLVFLKLMRAVEGPAMRMYAGVKDVAMQMHSLLQKSYVELFHNKTLLSQNQRLLGQTRVLG